MGKINGKKLIEWGFKPGKFFSEAIEIANEFEGSDEEIISHLNKIWPKEIEPHKTPVNFSSFLPEVLNFNAELNEYVKDEAWENAQKVHQDMQKLMTVPTVVKAAIMPDACPAGTIPVGGVIATKDTVHPGWHSSDICCSMFMTKYNCDLPVELVMNAIENRVHFGPTKKPHDLEPSEYLLDKMRCNPFLADLVPFAEGHFGTQGDGNHFYFVGKSKSDGSMCIVSHHGSRGLGAKLYKKGLKAAQKYTKEIAPKVDKNSAWLDINSELGDAYMEALELIEEWTFQNHSYVHSWIAYDLAIKPIDDVFNAHNFVFKKDGLIYHAKGATPAYKGRTIIPLNMAEPILVCEPANDPNDYAHGFAPHGAGRNMSRTKFLKTNTPKIPDGLDIRFHSGKPDLSELPSAYKNANKIKDAIQNCDLAKIVDEIEPLGSIMAGEIEQFWRKGK